MVYQAVSPEAIKWVETELDPFVRDSIIPAAPPHSLLHYCAALYPHDKTGRRLYYAISDNDARRSRLPLTFPDMSNQVVHVMSDAELSAFQNLYALIRQQFLAQPSPLFMADRFAREDKLNGNPAEILLASIFFGANLKTYPWS